MFYAKRITLKDKKLVNDVDYDGIKFPVNKEDFSKTEKKSNIRIDVFGYENKLTLPIYISDQKFGNSMDLLLVLMKTSYIMCTSKVLTDLFHKTKNNKKYFYKSCLHCFSSKNVLADQKEVCLGINEWCTTCNI